ncbi:O-antigen ligase family protein [Thermophilibacter provencensis]|uniref:O-antigen ligase family protein n=1 Tax=Thermophilibacter provencensis TaxID=1852386 RepID=UPI002942A6C2|nr:O-antigen ligase family protein [Thermophilibacter provencensis]
MRARAASTTTSQAAKDKSQPVLSCEHVSRGRSILQYLLIYLMLLVPGSSLMFVYGGTALYGIMLGCFIFCVLLSCRYRDSYGICLIVLLLINTFVTRSLVGGVGIEAFLGFAACVVCTQMAICCDYKNFLHRWINAVVVLASISVVMWALLLAFPSFRDLLIPVFPTDYEGTPPWGVQHYGHGMLLYSWFDLHAMRNTGIFTEPGKYQVVLNSALFLLLFWNDRIQWKSKRGWKLSIVIILLALVTCQSTTGYMGMLLVVLFYLLRRANGARMSAKGLLGIAIVVIAMVLMIDWSLNGAESVFYTQIVQKISGGGQGIDLSKGTGAPRMIMIQASLESIVEHPFGVGSDALRSLAESMGGRPVAASFFQYGATYGVIGWALVLLMVFYPVLSSAPLLSATLFMLLFLNTTASQTHLLYPSLLMIPMYIAIGRGWPLARERSRSSKRGAGR